MQRNNPPPSQALNEILSPVKANCLPAQRSFLFPNVRLNSFLAIKRNMAEVWNENWIMDLSWRTGILCPYYDMAANFTDSRRTIRVAWPTAKTSISTMPD